MRNLIFIGCGGFVGSVLRFLVGQGVHRLLNDARYPYGTLVVNVVGCFVLGLLGGLAENRQALPPDARAFLMIGLLGGFTTFSTFGYETMSLFREGLALPAFVNILASVVIGLMAVMLGFGLSMRM